MDQVAEEPAGSGNRHARRLVERHGGDLRMRRGTDAADAGRDDGRIAGIAPFHEFFKSPEQRSDGFDLGDLLDAADGVGFDIHLQVAFHPGDGIHGDGDDGHGGSPYSGR